MWDWDYFGKNVLRAIAGFILLLLIVATGFIESLIIASIFIAIIYGFHRHSEKKRHNRFDYLTRILRDSNILEIGITKSEYRKETHKVMRMEIFTHGHNVVYRNYRYGGGVGATDYKYHISRPNFVSYDYGSDSALEITMKDPKFGLVETIILYREPLDWPALKQEIEDAKVR